MSGPMVPTVPRSCAPGEEIAMELFFPQCWNGRDRDSPNHQSHLAYPSEGGGCPASHPVAIPLVSFHVLYAVPAGADLSRWRLSTDVYRADQPGGYAIQGGFINGWKDDIASTWVQDCIRNLGNCGSHMLGDGRVMEG